MAHSPILSGTTSPRVSIRSMMAGLAVLCRGWSAWMAEVVIEHRKAQAAAKLYDALVVMDETRRLAGGFSRGEVATEMKRWLYGPEHAGAARSAPDAGAI